MQNKAYSPVWREKFQVRSFDIGLNAVMRMSSICSYFQEIAGRHANHLDVGYHYMQENGKVWVLSRLFMNIHERPGWGQEFVAETWPLGIERIFYRRDYRFTDGDKTLIDACSYWLLLDLKSRRPTVVPIDGTVLKTNENKIAMAMPTDGFLPVGSDVIEVHKVKYSDLDQNRHVNNARYVEWIFDLLDVDLLDNSAPSFFSIEYKHEVEAGETVKFKVDNKTNPAVFDVEGIIEGSNQTCVRSRIVFRQAQ
jgi:acyl-ACP thioesterase